jgi:1-aminocyclopropane-1-carboxylate deaminase/D-cysteine desulfhydrase-like pyridoxal-dependent ACC family enzyme
VPLQTEATPVVAMSGLARAVGLEALWIKRDDLISASYGGGKVRKLETLLAAASASGKKRLVTFGSVGSHHALATAVHGRSLGFDVNLLLLPEPRSSEVKATLGRTLATGAEASLVGSMRSAEARARELSDKGDSYVIPAGGSSPLANVGFVAAGFELAEQIAAGDLEEPDHVYVPLGTTGSAAGLALGLAAAGLERVKVIAVRASSPSTSSADNVARAIADTSALLRSKAPSFPDVRARISIDGAELGRGYALTTPRADRARSIAAAEGLALETTYTAKAFASLVRDAREGHVKRALFWMTHDPRPGPSVSRDDASVPRDLAGWLA